MPDPDMNDNGAGCAHAIVVIGASAGGIAALTALSAALPPQVPVAFFVVLHMATGFESQLPDILSRAGPLPARFARDGDTIVPGTILVAPSDCHLLVRAAHVELSRGPRENHVRPAVDPTLRSAARAHGACVSGIVLSGTLGDGTMGLMAVKAHGGVTIVQDPTEAAFGGMPEHALQFAEVDEVLQVRQIAAFIAQWAAELGAATGGMETDMNDGEARIRARIDEDFALQVDGRRTEEESVFVCPDCGGVLWQNDEGKSTQFHCYQGHAYAAERLQIEKSEALENALWSAARALVERATLNRQLAGKLRDRGLAERAEALDEQARGDEDHLRLMRAEILETDRKSYK